MGALVTRARLKSIPLPAGHIGAAWRPDAQRAVLVFPPQKRKVNFSQLGEVEIDPSYSLLFVFTFSLPFGAPCSYQLHAYDPDKLVSQAWGVANVNQPSGLICFGNNNTGASPRQAWETFWNSPFNYDLSPVEAHDRPCVVTSHACANARNGTQCVVRHDHEDCSVAIPNARQEIGHACANARAIQWAVFDSHARIAREGDVPIVLCRGECLCCHAVKCRLPGCDETRRCRCTTRPFCPCCFGTCGCAGNGCSCCNSPPDDRWCSCRCNCGTRYERAAKHMQNWTITEPHPFDWSPYLMDALDPPATHLVVKHVASTGDRSVGMGRAVKNRLVVRWLRDGSVSTHTMRRPL